MIKPEKEEKRWKGKSEIVEASKQGSKLSQRNQF